MSIGSIKKKTDKGFGFIAPTEGGADVFFHMSACVTPFDQLTEQQQVSCETEQSPKGTRAIRVQAV